MLSRTSSREFIARFGMPVTVFHRAELLEVLRDAARDIPDPPRSRMPGGVAGAGGVSVGFTGGRRAAGGRRRRRGRPPFGGARQSWRFPGEIRYAGYTAWRGIARFRTAGLLAGETLGCGQRFGLVPIAGDRVYWYATDNVPEGGREESRTREGAAGRDVRALARADSRADRGHRRRRRSSATTSTIAIRSIAGARAA